MNPTIFEALEKETKRQKDNIELIASENFVSKEILELQGSILTNKYAEGYPGKKYYGGCEFIDEIENNAIELACNLFGAKYANVQPHSGSSANMAAYRALINKGDKVLGLSLAHGGHLTHGHAINFSGLDYEIVFYTVDPKTETINYDEIEKIAILEKPKLIIAGASAYPRKLDFKKFRKIADKCGAKLMVDMAHIAGLIAAGEHENPVPYADVVTTTTHKTLRGPRGGLILTNNADVAKTIDKIIFPGIQGGPLMHVIAAKAQCFYEALAPDYKKYIKQVIKNAEAFGKAFEQNGFKVISGGTDTHLILVDVKGSVGLTGLEAEKLLDEIKITVNKNTIPFDTETPSKASGIRLGTPAMTTRGLKEKDFINIANIICEVLKNKDNEDILNNARASVKEITDKYPLY
jgi:Glycine/serine hydroxymethyltransferase